MKEHLSPCECLLYARESARQKGTKSHFGSCTVPALNLKPSPRGHVACGPRHLKRGSFIKRDSQTDQGKARCDQSQTSSPKRPTFCLLRGFRIVLGPGSGDAAKENPSSPRGLGGGSGEEEGGRQRGEKALRQEAA